jgi:chromosome segregation ATPase
MQGNAQLKQGEKRMMHKYGKLKAKLGEFTSAYEKLKERNGAMKTELETKDRIALEAETEARRNAFELEKELVESKTRNVSMDKEMVKRDAAVRKLEGEKHDLEALLFGLNKRVKEAEREDQEGSARACASIARKQERNLRDSQSTIPQLYQELNLCRQRLQWVEQNASNGRMFSFSPQSTGVQGFEPVAPLRILERQLDATRQELARSFEAEEALKRELLEREEEGERRAADWKEEGKRSAQKIIDLIEERHVAVERGAAALKEARAEVESLRNERVQWEDEVRALTGELDARSQELVFEMEKVFQHGNELARMKKASEDAIEGLKREKNDCVAQSVALKRELVKRDKRVRNLMEGLEAQEKVLASIAAGLTDDATDSQSVVQQYKCLKMVEQEARIERLEAELELKRGINFETG